MSAKLSTRLNYFNLPTQKPTSTVYKMQQLINVSDNGNNSSWQLTAADRKAFVIAFSCLATLGVVANLAVVMYVVVKRLYRNFVSSHFIAHASFTNALACACLIPLFVHNMRTGGEMFAPVSFAFSLNIACSDLLINTLETPFRANFIFLHKNYFYIENIYFQNFHISDFW